MPRIPILSQTDYDSQHLSTRGATSEHRAGEAGRTEAVGPAQPGALRGGIATWLESGREQAHVLQVSVREVQTAMTSPCWMFVIRAREEMSYRGRNSHFGAEGCQSSLRMPQKTSHSI